jgi:hypothetical protein
MARPSLLSTKGSVADLGVVAADQEHLAVVGNRRVLAIERQKQVGEVTMASAESSLSATACVKRAMASCGRLRRASRIPRFCNADTSFGLMATTRSKRGNASSQR